MIQPRANLAWYHLLMGCGDIAETEVSFVAADKYALHHKLPGMQDFIEMLQTPKRSAASARPVRNVNIPQELLAEDLKP